MRTFVSIAAFVLLVVLPACRSNPRVTVDPVPLAQTVQAGCATCIFDMENVSGCVLAVMIEQKPYLVSGSDIDDHGDAHAADGFCNQARLAVVEGRVEGGKFVATRFELQP